MMKTTTMKNLGEYGLSNLAGYNVPFEMSDIDLLSSSALFSLKTQNPIFVQPPKESETIDDAVQSLLQLQTASTDSLVRSMAQHHIENDIHDSSFGIQSSSWDAYGAHLPAKLKRKEKHFAKPSIENAVVNPDAPLDAVSSKSVVPESIMLQAEMILSPGPKDYTDLLETNSFSHDSMSPSKLKPPNSLSSPDGDILRKRSSSSISSEDGDREKASPTNNKKSRGKYNCSRCGKPKDGHICALVESTSVAVQCEAPVLGNFMGKVIVVSKNRKAI